MEIEEPRNKKWGTIVFLDALGTKDIEPETTLERWTAFDDWADKFLDAIKTQDRLESWRLEDIQKIAFSDTFIMAIPQTHQASLIQTSLEITGELLTNLMINALDRELYLRGCVTLGYFYSSGNMVIGPAVNEAYKYHCQPQWIGISASPTAQYYLSFRGADPSMFPYEDFIPAEGFVRYPVPLKIGIERDAWALNWPVYDIKGGQERIIRRRELLRSRWKRASDIDVSLKYRNTIAFFNEMVENQPRKPSP